MKAIHHDDTDQNETNDRNQAGDRGRFSSWAITALPCLLIALYFLAGVVYAVVYFERYGSALPQFLRYILVPGAIAIALLLVTLLVDRKKTLLVGIYTTSILATLFAVEVMMTVRMIPILFGSLGKISDEQRQEFELENALIRGFTLRSLNRMAGVDALADTKLSGFPGARTLLCSSPEGLRIYDADRHGFNNPDNVYDHATDVMIVGDSFMEGFCLPENLDLAGVMRKRALNTVSFGIRGNGPLIELATIGRFAPTIRPKHVIMAFYEGNDWRNLGFELTEPWLREALKPGADFGGTLPASIETERRTWTLIQELTKEPVADSAILFKTALLRNFLALYRVSHALGVIYPKVPTAIPEFETILARAKAIVEEEGGTFWLLYIPDAGRFGSLLPTGFAFDQLRNRVIGAAEAHDIGVIDLVPAFEAESRPRRFYAPNGHFSVEGSHFAADVVSDAMSAR